MELQKVTELSEAPRPRRYEDACAAAHALDLVGERWALLVMRELMLGPKRFGDLRAGLPGISANVLTQRLEGLEAAGVLVRRRLPPPALVQVYELTPWGYEAEPIFQALGRWAVRSPAHDPTLPFSATSFLLSLRTMLDPKQAEGLEMRIGFRLGAESYLAHLHDGRIDYSSGVLDGADAIFSGSTSAMLRALYARENLEALEKESALRIEGDRPTAERFATLFPLPPKAGRPG